MVRIKSEMLNPGDLPIYDFPNWKHEIFYLEEKDEHVHLMKFAGNGIRVTIPEIELCCTANSQDDASEKVRLKALKLMAEVCVFISAENTLVVMPVRNHMVLLQEEKFMAVMTVGMLFTRDPTPEDVDEFLPWIPERVHDSRDFLENTEKILEVMEVMTA